MTIYDISVTLKGGLPVWPGDPQFERTLIASMAQGAAANVSKLTMSAHTGTHVDAPVHFVAEGSGIEQLSLQTLVGPCLVCDVHPHGQHIDAAALDSLALPAGVKRLLLKTANSQRRLYDQSAFAEDFVALTVDGAQWLIEHGIALVGVDYLSVEPFQNSEPVVHRTLLSAGIVPVEGLNLAGIATGDYTLVCLPLKLAGSDGAPARAILIRDEHGKG
jgi:arylformamidase